MACVRAGGLHRRAGRRPGAVLGRLAGARGARHPALPPGRTTTPARAALRSHREGVLRLARIRRPAHRHVHRVRDEDEEDPGELQ